MEFKAYMEGIWRKWWIIALFLVIAFVVGRVINSGQTSQYTATSTVQVNGALLANYADPTGILKLYLPKTPESLIKTPAAFSKISEHYPRLNRFDLQRDINVVSDDIHQVIVISVTDITPASAADIDNYLAQTFVATQNAGVMRQLDYYQGNLQQQISSLNNEISRLNLQIQQLTPQPAPKKDVVQPGPQAQQTIITDQYQLDLDQRNLYSDEQSLASIQRALPYFADAYVVLHPATESGVATTSPLSPTLLELIALGVGLLAALILIIASEYFSPFIRHRGEVLRLIGLPVFAELPAVFKFQEQQVLQMRRPSFFPGRITALRVICASLGVLAMRGKGNTVLFTSPRKKRSLAAMLGTTLAQNGYRTLLIDLDFQQPTLQTQIKRAGPCDLVTNSGIPLTFITKTANSHLFLLPATATIAQNMPMTALLLMELLPELQNMFDLIIIDAPPLDHGDTHLFAKQVKQIFLLVKKRRDSIKTLRLTHTLGEELKLNMQALLL